MIKTKGMDQRVTYDAILKELIIEANRFKGFGDAALMLKQNSEVDLEEFKPTLTVIALEEKNHDLLQAAANREYDEDNKVWKKRKQDYENTHKRNICAMISLRCEKEFLDSLEVLPDYEKFSFNDPLRFLEAIRQECVTFEEDEWPIASIANIMLEALTLSQKDGETVADYARRAKAAWEVFFGTFTIWAEQYHEKIIPDYKEKSDEEKSGLNDRAMDMLTGYILLRNADQKRFSDMFRDLSMSYAYGTKQWPESFDAARKMLEKVKSINSVEGKHSKDQVKSKSEKKSEKKPVNKGSEKMSEKKR
jgi:hypothetical protein